MFYIFRKHTCVMGNSMTIPWIDVLCDSLWTLDNGNVLLSWYRIREGGKIHENIHMICGTLHVKHKYLQMNKQYTWKIVQYQAHVMSRALCLVLRDQSQDFYIIRPEDMTLSDQKGLMNRDYRIRSGKVDRNTEHDRLS